MANHEEGMGDMASASNGGEVLVATSMENRHPPSMIIDGDENTFWVSTGLFPQHLLVAFEKPSYIDTVNIRTRFVKRLSIERCETPQPLNFFPVCEIDMDYQHGEVQTTTRQFKTPARYIKIHILDGYDDIVAVHSVETQGRPY